jgi:spore coat protein SA
VIYHLVGEPFSCYTGLALSRTAADIMRLDERSIAVCPRADDTWGFAKDRILIAPLLHILSANIRGGPMTGWRFIPSSIRTLLICRFFISMLSRLRSGDVVWCHNWPYVAEALVSSIHAKDAKLVYHAHNSIAPWVARGLFSSFTADAYIFNSECMLQEALQLVPDLKSTYAVHNGADDTLFYPDTERPLRSDAVPVVLYVGRVVPSKGVHVLLDAMRILHEERIPVICKVVGSSHAGGGRGKMTAYIRALRKNHSPNVQFEGFRSAKEVAQVYRNADIFCCPSLWQEPFGLVNIEAMASGLPVVASRVGGIPEIASGGGILLVEPGSPAELALALKKLISDRDLRVKIGSEGLASFKSRFTSTVIVRRYFEIVDGLMERKPRVTENNPFHPVRLPAEQA